ncbi:hypothetical protein [Algoriphagus sp. NG3]|uniref:hypothetical protein n=1 Tax=Algoriphagus sp. NG3 TaxID=3097546 RepID=UPI002A827AEC|nr:hypothetical protein [Algoriphagus sp. NG3]WPR77411.1 hypothetical protein SLW71_08630 [Algoriphagus sp. NG3]
MRKALLISFLLLIALIQINGEKVPVNEGAFGDGVFYREVGRFFLDNIENASYNLVQLTRILPFALLNLSFSAFHIVKNDEALRNGMIIWQVIYLALAIYWYFRISKKLRLNTAQISIGFILMFFNFAWLKSVWYQPFTPDLMAFALGMGQMNYFLRYEKFKLGMVSLLGMFVSPLLLISGMLMLFLPGDKLQYYEGKRPKSLLPAFLCLIIPLFIAALGWGLWGWGEQPWGAQLFHVLALISIPLLIVLGAKQNPINWALAIAQLKKRTKTDRLSKGIMGLAGILLLLVLLSGENEGLGIARFLRESGTGSLRFPWDFIISTGLHWGLPAVLTLVFLHRFYPELAGLGWAIVIILVLGLVFAVFFKISALAPWIPIWVGVLIKALKKYSWTTKELLLLGFFALLVSLAWLPINSSGLQDFLENRGSDAVNSFSIQKWAIHYPEYISLTAYAVLAVVWGAIAFFFYGRRKKYLREY